MTGGCWWSRDIAAKFKSINQSSFLFENEKRWIDLIWICGASRPREQSSPSIHSGMNCWLLFLRRVDGWVGLLFLILVGYGRCSANGSAKERKQTNKPTIQQQNKGKRTQFVFADSNTEWNEVCGGGERRQTSGAPTAGRQVHSFLQLLFRFNWRIKKLSEKKWKTTPTIPSNSSFHHIKLNSNKKSFIWLIWFVNEIEDCLIPFNIITVNRLHRN